MSNLADIPEIDSILLADIDGDALTDAADNVNTALEEAQSDPSEENLEALWSAHLELNALIEDTEDAVGRAKDQASAICDTTEMGDHLTDVLAVYEEKRLARIASES